MEATLTPIFASPLELSERDIQDLVAFLEALTAPGAMNLEDEIPDVVPSGLPVVEPR